MNYGKYKNVRNAAWQCLIDCNVTKLPIKVMAIARQLGIRIVENSKVKDGNKLCPGESGKSILQDGQWIIIFDETQLLQHCRFTIVHELGHILLGHKTKGGQHRRAIHITKPEEESEADVFASRLLAPACVLWALDLHTPEEIAKICDISHEAAEIRANRMEILYERDKFLLSPLEKQVYENFKKFINKQKNIPAEPPLNGDLDKHLLDKN